MQGNAENLTRLGWLAGGLALICAIAWTVALGFELAKPEYGGEALDVDFAVFWGAAQLTLAEGPLTPFDVDRLNEARSVPVDNAEFPMLWLYPPGWLTLILPLGTLPFFWAWLIFVLISFALFAAATREPARTVPGGWALVLAAPAVLVTMALGQTALIFAGVLALAIEAIRRERHMVAGLAIAAMTLKPQLGIAIPVALVAGREWRVIAWAIGGTILIVGLSLIWPGYEYWPHFFQGLSEGGERIRDSALPHMMTSGYGTGIMLGLDRDSALIAQGFLSLSAAIGLAWLWQSRADFDLKAAGLGLAVLLITPYAIYYEMVFAVLGCLYLARAGIVKDRLHAIVIILIWLAPAIGFAILTGPGFFFAAPAVAAAFVLALSAAARPVAD